MIIKNRLQYVDVCKGIGIIAVVLGHTFPPPVSSLMYMFHMPLFFFIGGYLFKIKNNKKAYFIDKSIQQLFPYSIYLSVVYGFMSYLYFTSESDLDVKTASLFMIRPIIGGLWLSGYATVFWFLTCFFLAQQLFNLTMNAFSTKVVPCVMFILLVLSYLNVLIPLRIPWNANVVLMAIPIFYIGYLSRIHNFNPNIFLIICLCVGAVILLESNHHNLFNMKYADDGIPVITLVSGLSIVYLILTISKGLAKIKHVSSFFSFLGEASFVIMFLHQPVQLLINNYITQNYYIRALVSIVLSLLVYYIAKRSVFGRAFFIGSKVDFLKVFKKKQLPLVSSPIQE